MLLVELKCDKCRSYSCFKETIEVDEDVPMISFFGIYIQRMKFELDVVRCLLCNATRDPIVGNAWQWLYWYAWWNGEEPDGASHLEP